MAQITLYCQETPGLKLGPGVSSAVGDLPVGDVIEFRDGFTTFDEETYPDWARWVAAPGSPTIVVVDAASGEATSADGAVECPVCGKLLKSEFGLKSHLKTHAPKP